MLLPELLKPPQWLNIVSFSHLSIIRQLLAEALLEIQYLCIVNIVMFFQERTYVLVSNAASRWLYSKLSSKHLSLYESGI
jgi:hypothetical protein